MRHALATVMIVAAALGLLGQATGATPFGEAGSQGAQHVSTLAGGGNGGAGGNDDSGWGG
ncbi:hypothetical protein ACIQJT_39890 [Streptomyces sp. NPDC091972]|uniref:hypothetical protein n=1 Tax=Streptomyces sp. NPDC091972 TaxID=3366007 RepID=UPI0038169662